jgi:hypothetical protein
MESFFHQGRSRPRITVRRAAKGVILLVLLASAVTAIAMVAGGMPMNLSLDTNWLRSVLFA